MDDIREKACDIQEALTGKGSFTGVSISDEVIYIWSSAETGIESYKAQAESIANPYRVEYRHYQE